MTSFYTNAGGVHTPTGYVTGPWSTEYCHAGPPCALLADGLHQVAPTMAISRISFEIERQIPILPLRIEAEIVRGGKKVQLVRGRLVSVEGTTYLTAHAWLMRIDRTVAPVTPWNHPLPRSWDLSDEISASFHEATDITDATELRAAKGEPFAGGPATTWVRQRVPLVADRAVSPYSTGVFACDWTNGFSQLAPFDVLMAINTDLTVYFAREPLGDRIAVEASTISQGLGLGMTDSLVYDASGFVGRSNQSIYFDAA